jgi:starch synthase (maltosyl-transferring)
MSQKRTVIEHVQPTVDHGRYPAKRIAGDAVTVTADIYADGHDLLRAVTRYRKEGARTWKEAEMELTGNDAWVGTFTVDELGSYEFQVEAWVDHFDTWIDGLRKKVEVESENDVDLAVGALLLDGAVSRIGATGGSSGGGRPAGGKSGSAAATRARKLITETARLLESTDVPLRERSGRALEKSLIRAVRAYPDRSFATRSDQTFRIAVDPPHARFSSWYELFPRSVYNRKSHHGTFRDVVTHLDYIGSMGFDVLYLPPIHPIGLAYRKGRNNTLIAEADDPGSPWAIGGPEGGHTAINPALGTDDDFRPGQRGRKARHARRTGYCVPMLTGPPMGD